MSLCGLSDETLQGKQRTAAGLESQTSDNWAISAWSCLSRVMAWPETIAFSYSMPAGSCSSADILVQRWYWRRIKERALTCWLERTGNDWNQNAGMEQWGGAESAWCGVSTATCTPLYLNILGFILFSLNHKIFSLFFLFLLNKNIFYFSLLLNHSIFFCSLNQNIFLFGFFLFWITKFSFLFYTPLVTWHGTK